MLTLTFRRRVAHLLPRYSPFASHFAMVPTAAVENLEAGTPRRTARPTQVGAQWTVRYKVEPDTGLEYDRQFAFIPADPDKAELGWCGLLIFAPLIWPLSRARIL